MDPIEVSSIIGRVPIFQGLHQEQVDRLLADCQITTVDGGEPLFSEGEQSDHMVVLLLGQLEVRSRSGAVLALISEGGVVGEMGVLTGERRSATVVPVGACTMLTISRDDLFALIEADKDLGFQIYRNVTRILTERLRDSNILLEQQYLLMEDVAGEAEEDDDST